MADTYIQVPPDSTGKKLRMTSTVINAETVLSQHVTGPVTNAELRATPLPTQSDVDTASAPWRTIGEKATRVELMIGNETVDFVVNAPGEGRGITILAYRLTPLGTPGTIQFLATTSGLLFQVALGARNQEAVVIETPVRVPNNEGLGLSFTGTDTRYWKISVQLWYVIEDGYL